MALDFNLSHLRYFYDAAILGSIAGAAGKNFVTSSSVSQAIKKLELILDVELVHHKRREFRLTQHGESLMTACEAIFASIRNFEGAISNLRSEPVGEFCLGSSRSIVNCLLFQAIENLVERYAKVVPVLQLSDTVGLKELLKRRYIDLAVTIDDGKISEFDFVELQRGQFCLVRSLKNMTGQKRYLVTKSRPEVEALYQYHQNLEGSSLPVFMVLDSWELIAQAAKEGVGIGLIPDFVLSALESSRLQRCSPEFTYPYRLVGLTRRAEMISKPTELVLSFIRTHAVNHA